MKQQKRETASRLRNRRTKAAGKGVLCRFRGRLVARRESLEGRTPAGSEGAQVLRVDQVHRQKLNCDWPRRVACWGGAEGT